MALLPSARNGQWYQSTYSAIPLIHSMDVHGVHLLDNGGVWVDTEGMTPVIAADTTYQELALMQMLPEGSVRHTVDMWGYPVSGYTSAPLAASGSITEDAFHWAYRDNWMCDDGSNLWTYVYQRRSWYKIDPIAHTYEQVAGTNAGVPRSNSTYLVDSHVGLSATFDVPGGTVHDGYLYMTDLRLRYGAGNPSAESHLRSVRRMKLEPPYPVETIFGGLPVGWVDDFGWGLEINPVTNLPNFFNSDVLWATAAPGLAVHDGYLYVLCKGQAGGFVSPYAGMNYIALRRISLTGGPIETLWYGLGDLDGTLYLTGQTPTNRDLWTDYAATPYGTRTASNHYDPFPPSNGTPELEGFGQPDQSKIAVMGDGSLIALNALYNHYLVKFDLPALISHFVANGPMRHNRATPFFQALHSGSKYDETGASWYPFVNPYNKNNIVTQWELRDGAKPLAGPIIPGRGFAINNNHPEWAGKVVFVHWAVAPYLSPIQHNWNDWVLMVSVLEPGNASTVKVTLSFEGRVLKGYGNAHGLQAPSAPAIITI